MNIKTNLIEEYVNFVDITKKENKNLWIYLILLLFIVIIFLILLFRNKINYSYYCNNYV